ncbi:MAG: hypothetical protein AB7F31_00530 [Parachlamydiales bacterium]
MISDILQGIREGYEVFDGLEDEAVSRVGGDWSDITFHQCLLLYATMGAVNQLSGMRIPAFARVGVAALPALLWYRHSQLDPKTDSWERETIHFLHENMWKGAFAVALVSNLALIREGEWLTGGIGLGFTLYQPAETYISHTDGSLKKLEVPHKVRSALRFSAQLIAIGAAIIYGDTFDRVKSLITGALLLRMWLPSRTPEPLTTTMVDLEKTIDESKLVVNRQHVEVYRSPFVPDVGEYHADDFETLFKGVEWKDNLLEALKSEVYAHDRWLGTPSPDGKNEIAFARRGMELFVKGLRSGQASAGLINNLDDHRKRAGHILAGLSGRKNRPQLLLRLALAAQHCNTGIEDECDQVYRSMYGLPHLDFSQKVGEVLAQRRKVLFERTMMIRHSELNEWVQRFFDPSARHNQSQFVQLLGGEVGHPDKARLDWDLHATGHLEQKVILSALYANTLPFFWHDYTVKEIISAVEEAIRVGERPRKKKEIASDEKEDKELLLATGDVLEALAAIRGGNNAELWVRQNAYEEKEIEENEETTWLYSLKREHIIALLVHHGVLSLRQ